MQLTTLPVTQVANSFLQHDFINGKASTTPMKLQKLVYLAHGWHLAIHDQPLIEEKFEAWPYGPVEQFLYHLFKQYRNSNITDYAKTWVNGEQKAFVVSSSKSHFTEVFDKVVAKYSDFSALQLSALTHQEGTPWSISKAKGFSEIPNDMIRDHFRGLVK